MLKRFPFLSRAFLRRTPLLLIALTGALGATAAQADTTEAVATTWRLQDYLDGTVVVWYTGSPCTSGNLTLLASASEGSKNRLWSIIMAAKIARQPVGIYYHTSSGSCVIDDFYLKETS